MFNTMTVTKAAGALIGSLLFLLLASWGASSLYDIGPGEHVAEGEEVPQAYHVAVAEAATDAGAGDAQPEVDFAALMAAADPAAGEKVFGKCKSCHKVDGNNATGPHLNGVVGRAVASAEGFGYSDAMKAHAGEVPTWEPDPLQAFLNDPKGVVPGTKMTFAGLKKAEDRANIIAYLQSLK